MGASSSRSEFVSINETVKKRNAAVFDQDRGPIFEGGPTMAKQYGPWDSASSTSSQEDVEAWIRKKAAELGEDPLSEGFAAKLGKETEESGCMPIALLLSIGHLFLIL